MLSPACRLTAPNMLLMCARHITHPSERHGICVVCVLLQHAITQSHPQPEELMDVEPALPLPVPAAAGTEAAIGSSGSAVSHPADDPAVELAGAASPPASAPLAASDDTPSASATPEQPPPPHKAPGDSAQRAGSVSPCVTDLADKLSLHSRPSKVCTWNALRSGLRPSALMSGA
jgi:hypothetical protein